MIWPWFGNVSEMFKSKHSLGTQQQCSRKLPRCDSGKAAYAVFGTLSLACIVLLFSAKISFAPLNIGIVTFCNLRKEMDIVKVVMTHTSGQ